MTVFLLFCFQNRSQLFDCLCTVGNTGRIVRCIDQYSHSLFVQCLLEGLEIDLEGLCIGRNHTHYSTCTADVLMILREERCKNDNLITRLCNQTERMRQRACCTDSHEDMFCIIVHAKAAV